MSLSLGVKLYGSVFIDDTRYVLTKIYDDGTFRLSGGNDDYEIKSIHSCEIYPDVHVFAGESGSKDAVRVIIDAPKDIMILRGKLYWQEKENREVEL